MESKKYECESCDRVVYITEVAYQYDPYCPNCRDYLILCEEENNE